MESIKARGIVAKRREYGESNCMLTLLCKGLGVVSASCYGVKSKKSKLRAASQVLTCCDFVLSKKTGDIFRVESAEIVDAFYPICEDIVKLSLANYFCDLATDWSQDDDGAVLSLLLNTLYVLAYRDTLPGLIKAVFEIRLAKISGYEPALDECIRCGKPGAPAVFGISGGIKCASCATAWDMPVSAGLLAALKYILTAEDGRIFSFEVTNSVQKELEHLAEKYLLEKSGRTYKSLDYYKKIM